VPDAATLERYTRQVIDNNGFAEAGGVRLVSDRQHVVPRRVGQRSPIEHVIYVVNENRTYDQVLGDLGRGNGDPSLTLFGRDAAPNHHKLAEQFTTLDNLYAVGEVSMDGWEWSTAASANSLDTKGQPTNYGGRGFFYAGEGGTLGAAPGVNPADSYIWDRLTRARLSFRNYGFWATGTAPVQVFNEPNLDASTDHQFPGFNMAISDQARFAEWLREFRGYERRGDLPSVEFIKFPRDHTCGTSPDCPTPKAMVADSDWATGQLVDAVSHSRFWKSTAIFVIEDDAQDGPDHVDAHRTVGHVISPYTQTGKVDSVFYSSVSMLRTMELILGLQPLTQFDAAANPMFNSFTDHPDFRPYDAVKPAQPLDEPNPPGAPLASESARMDFSREDRAPEQLLNQAIWKSVKGAGSAMPAPRLGGRVADTAAEGDED
jgi:Phosphoesterase family